MRCWRGICTGTRFGPGDAVEFCAVAGNVQLMATKDVMLSDTWTLSDRINVARYGWQAIDGQPNKTSGVSPASVGYGFAASNAGGDGAAVVAITNYFYAGRCGAAVCGARESRGQRERRATWLKGNHDFQFGGLMDGTGSTCCT